MKKYFDVETKGEEVVLIVIIIISISMLVFAAMLPPLPIV